MANFRLLSVEFEADFTEEQVRCFNKVATETNAMLDRLKTEANIEYNGVIPLFLPFDAVSPYEINVHNSVAFQLQLALPDLLDTLTEDEAEELLALRHVAQLEVV